MRKYFIRTGKYSGEHFFFESEKEFRNFFPNEIIFKWGRDNYKTLKTGMWVEAEDGYIVECLNANKLINKKKQIIYYFRFPNYIGYVYYRTDGKPHASKYLAGVSKVRDNSFAETFKYYNLFETKVKFATFVMAGMSLKEAYRKAAKFPHRISKSRLLSLMSDKVVINQIQSNLETLKKGIESKFSDERLLKELDELLTMSEKGSNAHRLNIEFILKLRQIIKNKNVEDIEEAKYEEQNPPFND